MQMIDVMKRLAELDANNPNVVKEGVGKTIDPRRVDHVADEIIAAKDADRPYYFGPGEDTPEFRAAVADLLRDMGFETSADEIDPQQMTREPMNECGMMPEMGMTSMAEKPTVPATINMTAGSAAELGSLLKDIVSLAGINKSEPDMPVAVGTPSVLEPAGDDMGPPEPVSATDSMRSVIDKLNPADDESDSDDSKDDKEKVDEYDNEPDPQTSGYGSMTPTGNDMHSKGAEAPKVNGGGNPMQKTMEQIQKDLFNEYQRFINEN